MRTYLLAVLAACALVLGGCASTQQTPVTEQTFLEQCVSTIQDRNDQYHAAAPVFCECADGGITNFEGNPEEIMKVVDSPANFPTIEQKNQQIVGFCAQQAGISG